MVYNFKMENFKKLKLQSKIKIIPTQPFNFDSTFHKPDHFTTGDNYWEPGTRWQTWNHCGENLGLKFQKEGESVTVSIYFDKKLPDELIEDLILEIKYRYNLDLDLYRFYEKFLSDNVLGPIINKWLGMRPGHPSSLYEYLIIGVLLQNASIRRSIQMFKTLLEKYGQPLEFDGKLLWCFWEPGRLKKVTVDDLRALKVGYRAKYIKKIDDQFLSGLINEFDLRKCNRETQMNELLKLYGVGPATVWYLLFDVFHNLDFLNHISPWEQKIYSKLFFDKDPEDPVPVKKLLKHFEKYGEYKQIAVHYIWEDLWWKRKNATIPWLEKLIRV